MDSMRIILIVLGVLAIGGLLAHGLWSIRQQGQARLRSKPMKKVAPEPKPKDEGGFDDDGIGQVRTVGSRTEPKMEQLDLSLDKEQSAPQPKAMPKAEPAPRAQQPAKPAPVQAELAVEAVAEVAEAVAEPPPARPEPAPVAEPVAAPEPAEQPEPVIVEGQPEAEPQPAPQAEPAPVDEVLVLNVIAREDSIIEGAELLPELLSMGFKFGEMKIFHRHKDANGRGPVLFSLANLVNPGTFELDDMEQFSTQGVALFMTLPNEGEAMKAFAMMLAAAQKLAEEFGCQVLDGDRNLVSTQTVQHYQSKIREFTRRQLLAAGSAV
ncbi:cell division protein ZipA [Gallaecimonas sp. GXIMD4217]|uniref:cell division protein ZipA n=1 Tax=Gallaecimonas sp. GXIMD4217 TaxID=3131927 RepID=UPI00311B0643